jgi:outer membrane protein
MKNVLLIVNALLVIAVGYLLYKNFNSNSNNISAASGFKGKDSLYNKKVLFAYIEIDSIQNNYNLAKAVQKEIKDRNAALVAQLDRMDKTYQSKLSGYQQKAQTMTEEQAAAARKDMEETQSQMMGKGQSLKDEFNQFVTSKNMSLMKNIQDYLKKFNADGTYSFIFSYEPGLFYYKDTAYDITSQVLKGLNEQYKAEKNK